MRYPVITIRQPWAALIVSGVKDVENRKWPLPERYIRRRVLIHASARPTFSKFALADILMRYRVRVAEIPDTATRAGHIIGEVYFTDCLPNYGLPLLTRWCEDDAPYWWHIGRACVWPVPIPAKGRLGIWSYELDI